MKNIFKISTVWLLLILFFPMGCSDLDEMILDEVPGSSLVEDAETVPNLALVSYGNLRNLWWRQNVWGLQEMTTDEAMIPARGNDWYDGGVWIEDQLHLYHASHRDVVDTWNGLSNAIGRTNYNMLLMDNFETNPEIERYKAEMQTLIAYYSYYFLDLWGVVPYREYTETDFSKDPQIYRGEEAFQLLVDIITENYNKLGTKGEVPYGRVNKDVADALLAKLYLNKEVYTGTPDWAKTIEYCDRLINSGKYQITDDYFSIFAVNNHETQAAKDEAIFVSIMADQENMGVDQHVSWIHFTLHYNQRLGGGYAPWNGAVCLEGFYNKFDHENDLRVYDDRIKTTTGANLGFLVGQQYDETGAELKTRQKDPLNYTVDCPLEGATEAQGVRVMKYEPKVPPIDEFRCENDYVIFRISDIYLMRAEAKFRSGKDGVEDLNAVRRKRGLGDVSALSEEIILNERGFELYWEGHRRQDLIRFGKYTAAWGEKPVTSADKELFPIPQDAIDVVDGLEQNPGY